MGIISLVVKMADSPGLRNRGDLKEQAYVCSGQDEQAPVLPERALLPQNTQLCVVSSHCGLCFGHEIGNRKDCKPCG